VDGLIWAASMVVLDASRRNRPVPRLAAWSLGAGIVATVGANLAHGIGHGPIGALVSAWPALALVGAFELLVMLIRTTRQDRPGDADATTRDHAVSPLEQDAPPALTAVPTLEQTVHAWYQAQGPGKVMKLGRDLRCHNCRDVPGVSEGGGRDPGGTMEALTLTVVCHEGTPARSCHLPP